MHVICKKCSGKIAVAGRPGGSTSLKNVQVQGNVHVGGGGIGFGPGGSISFRPGGKIGFGPPQSSAFTCPACGTTAEYTAEEIKDD
jgi:hypothetical protein